MSMSRPNVRGVAVSGLALAAAWCTPADAHAATHTVAAGGDIQAAIDAAAPGDTVEVEAGEWIGLALLVDKALTLRAVEPRTVRLLASASPPPFANAGDAAVPTGIAIVADDVLLEGFELAYYSTGIAVSDAQRVEVRDNRVVSCFSAGFTAWDTKDVELHHNAFLDPYLADDGINDLWDLPGVDDAQMDYGANFYGTIDSFAHHNYFAGVFNQALSFKDGNLNGHAAFNTFEGFIYTALFFGQNPDRDGTFDVFGQDGIDAGHMQAIGNVFRPAREARGALAPYRARTPIRIWHVDGQLDVIGNVVDGGHVGIYVECHGTGCATGTVHIADNVLNGRTDLDGEAQLTGRCGVEVDAGSQTAITVDHNTIAHFGGGVCTEIDTVAIRNTQFFANGQAVAGEPDEVEANNAFESGPAPGGATEHDPRFAEVPDYELAAREEIYAPRSCLARALWLSCDSPDLAAGIDGTHIGAFGAPCHEDAPAVEDPCLLQSTDAPPGGDGGSDEDGGSDGADETGGDADGEDSGAAGSDGAGDGAEAATADGSGGSEGGEAGAADGRDPVGEGGCGCRSGATPRSIGLWTLLALAGVRRRRRGVRPPGSRRSTDAS